MQSVFPGKPTITSIIISSRRRLVYNYDNGFQMVQQYDLKTHELLLRKTKKPSKLMKNDWFYQIGQQLSKPGKQEFLIQKSNLNPIFTRKDTLESFQWRIRNLVYPADVYQVKVDEEKDEIVIQTSNKKYFKRFEVPDLKRGWIVKLKEENLSWQYGNNTLVVSYKKPQEVLNKELYLRKEFQNMNLKNPKENDIECSTQ